MIFLQESAALGQGSKRLDINASDTLNGINLQDKATKLSMTQMENLPHMTSKKLRENGCQMQNCGHSEAHAQILALLETELALGGEQSRMFFEVIRLLQERITHKKTLPSYLIMENVKNLLSSNQGRDFAEVIYQMDKVGYDPEWAVIDSSDVVPQHRERIYIVGHLRGECFGKVFPIQRKSEGANRKPKIKIIGNVSKTHHHSDDVMSGSGISKTITAQNAYKHTPKVAVRQNGGSKYITAQACLTPDRLNKRQNGRRFKEDGEPSFTLTAADRHGVMLDEQKDDNSGFWYHGKAIRKLTPLECWRLQGFSDEQFAKAKEAGISNSQLYKQAGNAVTVPVVEAIGEKLNDFN